MPVNNDYKYLKFNDFWQNSLQRIENITKSLESEFYTLEKKYYDFDTVYDRIITEINTLSSIYSGINTIKGRDYVLKLKALLEDYRKRYTRQGIDFRTIYSLNTKINYFLELSFDSFPKMDHSHIIFSDLSSIDDTEVDENIKKYNELKISSRCKWITFTRNKSYFIIPYKALHIIKSDQAEIKIISDDKIIIKHNEQEIHITDIFSRYAEKNTVKYFIITDNSISFASEKLGRIIMADRDIIKNGLKPISGSNLVKGRIRIFGKNHILL